MADRTVKVKLTADISEYTASLVKAAAMTRGLGSDIERGIDRNVGPAMQRSGEKSGGILARGINQGVIRNSPLIVAGVAAALAAGAPVMLASATALFGGIGAIAAAQTTEVREAWTDLGHDIRDGAVQDASILVPVYVGMADKIGAAFQRMRPEIRDAFEAAAPQIDRFGDSLTQTAENALPGLVRAIERGGPVIDGLGSLMESVGTGISDFFDAMSDDNADAAGEAFEDLGDALEAALPLLGELLGTGAEIATDVLPAVAAGLNLTHGLVKLLGPALAPVVTGFIALKAAKAASGFLDSFAGSAQRATTAMTGSAVAGSRVGTTVGGLSRSLPLLALATAGLSVAFSKAEEDQRRFGTAADEAFANLRKGGAAAEEARHQIDVLREASEKFDGQFLGMGSDIEGEFKRAEAASRDLAFEEKNLRQELDGVTASMAAVAAQAAASANSDLAYRLSVDATEEAVAALVAAQASGTATADELDDASLAVESALLRQAEAARQSAVDLNGHRGEAVAAAEGDAAMLAELLKLRDTMGNSFPAALNTTISRLQGATNAGMVAAAQFNQLGLDILSVPDSKTVIVSSTTPEQIALLEQMGFKVETLPDKSIRVTALTGDAENAINHVARTRNATIQVHTTYSQSGGGAPRSVAAPNRASGGPVSAGMPYKVGEYGQELFVPRASGTIIPAGPTRQILSGREQSSTFSGREFSGSSVSASAPSIDYDRLAAAVTNHAATLHIDNYNEARQSPGEIAEAVSWKFRTGS